MQARDFENQFGLKQPRPRVPLPTASLIPSFQLLGRGGQAEEELRGCCSRQSFPPPHCLRWQAQRDPAPRSQPVQILRVSNKNLTYLAGEKALAFKCYMFQQKILVSAPEELYTTQPHF